MTNFDLCMVIVFIMWQFHATICGALSWVIFKIANPDKIKQFHLKEVRSTHWYFNLSRALPAVFTVMLMTACRIAEIGYGVWSWSIPVVFVISCVAIMAVFPFYHDGMYYVSWGKDQYKRGWMDWKYFDKEETLGDAKSEKLLHPALRVTGFVIGWLLVVVALFLQ